VVAVGVVVGVVSCIYRLWSSQSLFILIRSGDWGREGTQTAFVPLCPSSPSLHANHYLTHLQLTNIFPAYKLG
jgi:hypothetical protein